MRDCALVAMLALASCATAPQVHQFQKSWTMPCSFDKAWSATVELFAERGWPIATLEKDSGLIVSDWVSLGPQDRYTDCGSPGLAIPLRREARFNVFIRPGETGPSLTINTTFRELRSFDQQTFYRDCTSTGALESELEAQILAKAQQGVSAESPSATP
jgi:hypothetical protein